MILNIKIMSEYLNIFDYLKILENLKISPYCKTFNKSDFGSNYDSTVEYFLTLKYDGSNVAVTLFKDNITCRIQTRKQLIYLGPIDKIDLIAEQDDTGVVILFKKHLNQLKSLKQDFADYDITIYFEALNNTLRRVPYTKVPEDCKTTDEYFRSMELQAVWLYIRIEEEIPY